MPTVGARVTVAFLGDRLPGVVEDVQEDGRRVLVALDDGSHLTFALSRATGRFVRDGEQSGARLVFEGE